jgi:hypothetical protein
VKNSLLSLALAATALTGQVLAQGGGAATGTGLPSSINAPRTIPQQFASKLKLDREQAPVVDEILSAAASEAAPHAQQMLQLRQRLLNASRANLAEEVKAAQDAYAASAAKIAAIEAAAFAKVYAQLKPNQQKDGAEAFALIAGLFSNAPAGGGAPRGGMRGQGGAR